MGDVSGGNGSMNIQLLSQQDWHFNKGDRIGGNDFINGHTLSQCNDSIKFKEMYGYVENYDASSGYVYVNSHTLYKQNGLESLINYNDRDDN